MASTYGRITSTFRLKNDSANENDHVFADELLPSSPCFSFFPKKSCRLSVARNSERLRLIQLSEKKPKQTRLIRRKDEGRNVFDPFQKYRVPELILSQIFSNLGTRDLVSVSGVSRKFRNVGKSSANWKCVDAYERPVSEYSLASIMKTKVRVLRLAGAKSDPMLTLPDRLLQECLFVPSRLEFLDVSRANLTQRQLLILLRPCRKLLCLSLEGNVLDDSIASCIAANEGLIRLDISMTEGLTEAGALNIFSNCQRLEQLNVAWCGMDTSILHVLFENITTKIRRLNLSGSHRRRGLNDEHIQMMTNACPHLVELDLSDNNELGKQALHLIIDNFAKLQILSLNRCFSVDPGILENLARMRSLRYLNLHGIISSRNVTMFPELCERFNINTQVFSFIAKPVISNSPTSQIWGQSVKGSIF